MKIAIVVGTRPEIIKMSPIIHKCQELGIDYSLIHTQQHYSPNMETVFFEELKLPSPDFNLQTGSGSHGEVTGKILINIEKILSELNPDIVFIEGDTNSVLATALASAKLHIKIAHIEAGLRSKDKTMPEEINRIISDHISELLFAPTKKAKENLIKEGLDPTKIFITGNTIVDAIFRNLDLFKNKNDILKNLKLTSKDFILLTAHRQENVDNKERLEGIIKGVRLVSESRNLPVIFPIHPRTNNRIKDFKIKIPENIRMVPPLGFLEFLFLESNAHVILTDSGGVQEEACILKVPCVTLRDNTERTETLDVRSNILVGTNPAEILRGVEIMERNREWENPFGDGTASRRILEITLEYLIK